MPRSIVTSLFISIISVAMCAQLILLPTRTGLWQYFGSDHPRVQLPTASNGKKTCCFGGHGVPVISLNRHGQWTAHGEGIMNDQQVETYLHTLVKQEQAKGFTPLLRLRIPAKAPAKRFIRMTHAAQEAGINNIYLAVWQPKPYQ